MIAATTRGMRLSEAVDTVDHTGHQVTLVAGSAKAAQWMARECERLAPHPMAIRARATSSPGGHEVVLSPGRESECATARCYQRVHTALFGGGS